MTDISKIDMERINGLLDKLEEVTDKLNSMKYVVETWNEGTEWYRVWSDGWIEQGGQSYNAVDSEITIQLHKPYTNSDYFITQTTGFNGAWSRTVTGWHIPATIVSVTNSSFIIHFYSGNGLNIRRWYTCGY